MLADVVVMLMSKTIVPTCYTVEPARCTIYTLSQAGNVIIKPA